MTCADHELTNRTANFAEGNTGACVCDYQHYAPSGSSACRVCDISCEKCNGDFYNSCTECPPASTNREDLSSPTGGTCLCKGLKTFIIFTKTFKFNIDGFYSIDSVDCSACHFTCGTCSDFGVDQCDSCLNVTS